MLLQKTATGRQRNVLKHRRQDFELRTSAFFVFI